MTKTALLAASAVLALCAGGAASAAALHPSQGATGAKVNKIFPTRPGNTVLYNQNSNGSGEFVSSQNFTSGSFTTYDDTGADDFVVPKGKKWTVREVDVTGEYSTGGPAASENVTFYKDANGVPGKVVKALTNLTGTDTSGSFAISLGKKGVKLKAGHYWVGVVVNMNYTSHGQWYWENTANAIQGTNGLWEDPGGGFGVCPTWGNLNSCIKTSGGNGIPNADFMFELQGRSK